MNSRSLSPGLRKRLRGMPTPAGVGMPRQRFLKPGDKLRLFIEKIGELTHRVA